MIIVQVNKKTPHVMGTQMHIHVSHVDYICEVDRPLIFEFLGVNQEEITETDRKIGAHIAPFIKDGKLINRIPCTLPAGSIVTTLRTDVQYIVTEFGVANLRYKSIADRVKSMINISHPNFRDRLREEAKENGLLAA